MNRVMRNRVLFLAAGMAIGMPAAMVSAGVAQPDFAAIRGDQSRALLGDGKGVVVAVVDGGVDASHPALAGSQLVAKDFSKSGTTDDDRSDVGHGTGIAAIMVGHDTVNGYVGLAPAATFVNARVANSSDFTTDDRIANGIIYAVNKGARVINLSLGQVVANPDTSKLTLICDYVAEKYGAVIVVAAGNENASASGGTPNAQYNGFTVGATSGPSFQQITSFSNYALDTDLRSKPDLVAPGEGLSLAAADWESGTAYAEDQLGTSFAAPMVGGITAQLMGYGHAHHLSDSPLVLKAVMLAGTTKVSRYDGSAWSPRDQISTATGTTIDEPLDAEQGAGQVDGVGAYTIYGKKTSKSVPVANWKQGRLGQNGTFQLKLGKLKAGEHLDAALTWLRHVSRDGGGPDGLDAADTFAPAATLADFNLTLLLKGKKVITSDSSWDNLEYLSLDILEKGNYSLLVDRLPGSGLAEEDFGIAARVLAGVPADAARTGASRARMASASQGALKSFEVTVPEPTGVGAVAICVVGGLLRRRRRRSI
jgi:subtilisin family serine protease